MTLQCQLRRFPTQYPRIVRRAHLFADGSSGGMRRVAAPVHGQDRRVRPKQHHRQPGRVRHPARTLHYLPRASLALRRQVPRSVPNTGDDGHVVGSEARTVPWFDGAGSRRKLTPSTSTCSCFVRGYQVQSLYYPQVDRNHASIPMAERRRPSGSDSPARWLGPVRRLHLRLRRRHPQIH